MNFKIYRDDVQMGVTRIFGRSSVRIYTIFKYKMDCNTGMYIPQFPLRHKQLIVLLQVRVEEEAQSLFNDLMMKYRV